MMKHNNMLLLLQMRDYMFRAATHRFHTERPKTTFFKEKTARRHVLEFMRD